MYGADTAGLRALGSRLQSEARDAAGVRTRITSAADSLESTVDAYERRAVRAFQGKWDSVGGIVRTLETASTDVAAALSFAATALDRAQSDWTAVVGEAAAAGFTVIAGAYPTVQAPAHADASATSHAAELERRAQAAADAAAAAQRQLQHALDAVPIGQLAALAAGPRPVVSVNTGNSAVDADTARVVGALLAAHAPLSAHA